MATLNSIHRRLRREAVKRGEEPKAPIRADGSQPTGMGRAWLRKNAKRLAREAEMAAWKAGKAAAVEVTG